MVSRAILIHAIIGLLMGMDARIVEVLITTDDT